MGKGRDKELIKLRDEALCRRYYYWTEVQRLRFDDALKVLSEREFFISEERIMTIIRRKTREGSDRPIRPIPKVKAPRLTAAQLELFLPSDSSYTGIAVSSCSVNEKTSSNTLMPPGMAYERLFSRTSGEALSVHCRHCSDL